MMINSITIDSRLTTKVRYSATANGTPMATFSVANNQGKRTNFFDVVAYSKTANYARNYLHKSQKCGITGTMEHTIKPNGQEYYEIVARMLDPNRDNGSKFKASPESRPTGGSSKPFDVEKTVSKALSKMPKNNGK